jgi:hypothetical protein
MKWITGSAAVVLGVFVFGACGFEESDDSGWGVNDPQYDSCHAYSSCQSCTPIWGCGWCFDSNGSGQCVSDPGYCATSAFSWTWNPDGCRVAADAGVGFITPPNPPVVDASYWSLDAASSSDDAGEGDASPASDAGDDGPTFLTWPPPIPR